jgi:large subunit ribosomal protein L10
MARTDKAAVIDELSKLFEGSQAAVLTEYRGLTVAQLSTLRRSLGPDTTYAVVKNTLTKRAAAQAGVSGLDDQLAGPSAIAFIGGDPVKGLRAFAKDHEALVIKAGYMDGRVLSAAEVGKLADLESREVLLAKLAGAMKAKMGQAAALFNAPLSKAARTVEALRVKAEEDPSVLAGGAGIPAAPAAPESSDVVEAASEVVEPAPADEAAPSDDASLENSEG